MVSAFRQEMAGGVGEVLGVEILFTHTIIPEPNRCTGNVVPLTSNPLLRAAAAARLV